MLKFYKFLIKFLELVLNFMFVIQIALMITVFLTATYWFLDLIDCSAFEFAAPLADSISDFVRIFYQEDIEIGGQYIDGALLLFDILALIAVFIITKSKYYVYRAIEHIEYAIKDCLKKFEDNFNKELQQEAEIRIRQCNNVAILVKFEVKSTYVDYEQPVKPEEKADEAFKIFYSALKTLSGCKFAKTDDKMLIMLDNFSRVDNLLNFVDTSINKIRMNLKQEKWTLSSFVAVDVYDPKVDFKTKIYPILEKLLSLRHRNEALCLGNFNLRYGLSSNHMYNLVLKGPYNIDGESDVFSIVKKN